MRPEPGEPFCLVCGKTFEFASHEKCRDKEPTVDWAAEHRKAWAEAYAAQSLALASACGELAGKLVEPHLGTLDNLFAPKKEG